MAAAEIHTPSEGHSREESRGIRRDFKSPSSFLDTLRHLTPDQRTEANNYIDSLGVTTRQHTPADH